MTLSHALEELELEEAALPTAIRAALLDADIETMQRLEARQRVMPVLKLRALEQDAREVMDRARQLLEGARSRQAQAGARRQEAEAQFAALAAPLREQIRTAIEQEDAARADGAALDSVFQQAGNVVSSGARLLESGQVIEDITRSRDIADRLKSMLASAASDLQRVQNAGDTGRRPA